MKKETALAISRPTSWGEELSFSIPEVKRRKGKIISLFIFLTVAVLMMGLPFLAAYEAQVIQVTAHIVDPIFAKRATGPTEVPVGTLQEWTFTFRIHNEFNYPMSNLVVKDNFGANLTADFVSKSKGEYLSETNPVGNQQRFAWTIPELKPSEVVTLVLKVSTGLNPAGKQEFTTPGSYELNSGANLKWFNQEGKQESLESEAVKVTAINRKG